MRLHLALAAALIGVWAITAHAASTIQPNLLPLGIPANAGLINQNFGNAINDVNALQTQNAGVTPPSNPSIGDVFLQIPQNSTTFTLNEWDGKVWVPIGSFDSVNHIWMPPIGGGVPPTILSATTTDLGSVPQATVSISGVNAIQSFGASAPAGTIKVALFTAATPLVNSASLILPGGANLTQVAGSNISALALGGGVWRVLFDSIMVAPGGAVAGNNAALEALPSTATSFVTRLGFATPGDAPTLGFIPSASACSLNAGAGDGGSQVPSADGNCWIANYEGDPDIREWGAKGDNSTDIGQFIQAAYNANVGRCIFIPAGIYLWTSPVTIGAQPPCFSGAGWNENDGTLTTFGTLAGAAGTWIHIASTSLLPVTISGRTATGSGQFNDIAWFEDQPAAVAQSGTMTAGSPIVTGLSNTGPLTVGMAISGAGAPSQVPPAATVLSIDSSSQIHMSANAGSSGTSALSFWAPAPYQYIFTINNTGGRVDFNNMYFYNSTHCISINNAGRVHLGDLEGQPLGTCITVDNDHDLLFAGDVDFFPNWTQVPYVNQYTQSTVDPFVLNRQDACSIKLLFEVGWHSGLRLSGSSSGVADECHINQLYADYAKYGLWIDNTATGASVIIDYFITDGGVLSGNFTANSFLPGGTSFRIDGADARVQIANMAALGTGGSVIGITNTTAGNDTVQVGALNANAYNQDNNGSPFFSIANATTPSTIQVAQAPLVWGILSTNAAPPFLLAGSNGIYRIPGLPMAFTPVLQFGASAVGLTGTEQGSVEFANDNSATISLNFTAMSYAGGGSGPLNAAGLPVSCSSSRPESVPVAVASGFLSLTSPLQMTVFSSTSLEFIQTSSGGTGPGVQPANVGPSFTLETTIHCMIR
jgi:hypothetical protein